MVVTLGESDGYEVDDYERVLVFDEGRLVHDAPPASAVAFYRDLMAARP